jgi:hypothetical protein
VIDEVVERALADLGRHVAWPPAPDLAAAVRAELESRPRVVVPLRRRRPRRLVLVAAAAVLVLGGLLAASPGLRAALLELLRIRGARIEVQPTPSPLPTAEASPSLEDLVPGSAVSLAEARREASFAILLPLELGRPDEVVLFGSGDSATVSLAYRPRPGFPAAGETGYAVVLTELQARPDQELIGKLATQTQIDPVVVGGEQGYWIEGPHSVALRHRGLVVDDVPRLSASSLLWTRGPLTLRLEADIAEHDALALARSVA